MSRRNRRTYIVGGVGEIAVAVGAAVQRRGVRTVAAI